MFGAHLRPQVFPPGTGRGSGEEPGPFWLSWPLTRLLSGVSCWNGFFSIRSIVWVIQKRLKFWLLGFQHNIPGFQATLRSNAAPCWPGGQPAHV